MTAPAEVANAQWKAKVAIKRAQELAKIPQEWRLPANSFTGEENNVMGIPAKCGILSPAEVNITEKYTAVELAKSVQSSQIKATDVAVAFCKRAAIAQQLTNCLTETMFDDAIKRGKYLDAYLAENKKPVGPLHGVPISIKDGLNYVGVQSTLGYVSFLDNPPPTKNSPLVDILLELGAILHCKTNVPQSLMTADSENNVFGRTLNPHNLKLTAGGSSGGEGACVAMKGSLIGVGTDIGGSIRIPALCCGTYGFKPSTSRVPYGYQTTAPGRAGSPGIPSVAGPLANSLEDADFFLRHVLGAAPWDRDPFALAIPWRSSVADSLPSKLRIGYWAGDADFPVHPPIVRALNSSAKKLAAAGHEIIPVSNAPSLKQSWELATDFFSLDPKNIWRQHVESSGEPIVNSLEKTIHFINKRSDYTVDELFDFNVMRSSIVAAWHKIYVDNELDVLLCPGANFTAMPHDLYGGPPYTAIWNLMEYPAVILPVGFADRSIDTDDLATPDPTRPPYSSEDVHGAPTSIQLVARRYQDEELMSAALVIDKALKQ